MCSVVELKPTFSSRKCLFAPLGLEQKSLVFLWSTKKSGTGTLSLRQSGSWALDSLLADVILATVLGCLNKSFLSNLREGRSSLSKCFLFFFFNLSFGYIGFLLLRADFSLVAASKGYCSLQCVGFSHCSGFSCWGAWALGAQASLVAVHGPSSCGTWALEHAGFSSCGTWAQ